MAAFGEAATLLTRRPPCLLARTQVDLPFVFHFTSYPTLNYQCVCCHSGRVAKHAALRSFLPSADDALVLCRACVLYRRMTPVEESLSQSMVEYWTSFGMHGKPECASAVWPVAGVTARRSSPCVCDVLWPQLPTPSSCGRLGTRRHV